jgi:transposase-like protein
LNVPKKLLDQLVSAPMTQCDLERMFRSLKKAVIERAMKAEMSDHLRRIEAGRPAQPT